MIYFVVDIETRALEYTDLSDEDKSVYNSLQTEDEKEQWMKNLALNPFTSSLVCISIKKCRDLTHEKGWVLINSEEKIESSSDTYKFLCYDEKKLFEKFWEFFSKIDYPYKFITFRGRDFDFPYIMLRSAYLGVPNYTNLMSGSDWNMNSYHIDLAKELTFFKYSNSGAIKLRSLDYYCKRFLNKTSKTEKVSGSLVTDLFKEGKIKEICEYASYGVRDGTGDTDITFELFVKLIELNFI